MSRPVPGRLAFWTLFGATLAIYAAMAFWTMPAIVAAAGGLLPFDLRFAGYGVEEARAFLAALDAGGRTLYLGPQRWLDLVYPGLLAATLVWATRWGFRDVRSRLALALLSLPALAGAGFDWLENARVAALLRADAVTPDMVARASLATVAKSAAHTLAMLIALAAVGRRGWKRWRMRR